LVYHGGARKIKKGMIDFSYSTNPYYPRFIKLRLKRAKFELYPYCEDTLEERIRSSFNLEGEVTIGAGVTELLYMVAYATRKVPSLIMRHTYGEYQRVSRLFDKQVDFINSLDPQVEDFSSKGSHTIFFANPNNPTGKLYDYIEELIDSAERNGSLVILDESFIKFADRSPRYTLRDNVVVLRSFTKEYNMPGIRAGYAISSKVMKKKMVEYRMPWGIGATGCAAIDAILENQGYLKSTIPKVKNERNKIINELRLKTEANFFLAEVKSAEYAVKMLAENGILVRNCSSFGLPSMIRFSVRKPNENKKLVSELLKLEYLSQPAGIHFA